MEDNEIKVGSAYLLAGETEIPCSPEDESFPVANLPIFDPPQARGKPPGCQPIGMDTCHIECYINSMDGNKIEMVADSGAGATLIA